MNKITSNYFNGFSHSNTFAQSGQQKVLGGLLFISTAKWRVSKPARFMLFGFILAFAASGTFQAGKPTGIYTNSEEQFAASPKVKNYESFVKFSCEFKQKAKSTYT